MSGNFFYNQVLNFLQVGSSYKINGYIYIHSGQTNYAVQIINSDASSVLLSEDIEGQHGKWSFFSKIFIPTSDYKSGYLRFTLNGSGYSFSTFDAIELIENKDMLALGVVQIYPEWEMKKETVQNRIDHRTKGGKLYSYLWGDYDRLDVPLEYVQNSKAAIINSWWAVDALIHFKIYSGGTWATYSCHLMNDTAPFDERVKPYDQYRAGRLELETF